MAAKPLCTDSISNDCAPKERRKRQQPDFHKNVSDGHISLISYAHYVYLSPQKMSQAKVLQWRVVRRSSGDASCVSGALDGWTASLLAVQHKEAVEASRIGFGGRLLPGERKPRQKMITARKKCQLPCVDCSMPSR